MTWLPRRVLGAVAAALVSAATVAPATTAATPAALHTKITPAQARASEWWLSALGVTRAQRISQGAGVTVCVIDGGVTSRHPDLRGTTFVDGTDQSGGRGAPDGLTSISADSHGTQVAALIAGQGQGTNHSQGILGVAPRARIISVTVGLNSQISPLEDAVAYCADHGAQVINISLTGHLDHKAIAYAQARDAVVLAGTGNGGGHDAISGIAGSWGVLGVGGVDANLRFDPLASLSGPVLFDPQGRPNPEDLGGVAVMGPFARSATPKDAGCPTGFYGPRDAYTQPAGLYARTCGTSMATAITSGVVALVRATHPELNAANVVNRVLRTAKPPPDGSAAPSPLYGFGVVDAYAAVTADVPTVDANPLGSCYTGGRGVWDPRVTPDRAEPAAHATVPAAAWDETPAIATAAPTTSADTPEAPAGPGSGAGLAVDLLIGLAVALLAVLAGVVTRRVRAGRSERSPAGGPPAGGSTAGPPPPDSPPAGPGRG